MLLLLLLRLAQAEGAVCPPVFPGPSVPKAILVLKADRLLGWYENGKLARTSTGDACFPVALGFAPEGPKRQKGDGRTPEGNYHIIVKNAASSYHLSLGISYPNAGDADAGLAAGTIDPDTYRRIRRSAHPPQNTAMGGDIFLHGGGVGADWTLGCVALENETIEWLFTRAEVGMPVTILPGGSPPAASQ